MNTDSVEQTIRLLFREQNGQITFGTVKEKDEARQEYERARNEGRTASEVRKQ